MSTIYVDSEECYPYAIGTQVKIKNWPVGGKVIGHCSDGTPIVQPEAMRMDLSEIETV